MWNNFEAQPGSGCASFLWGVSYPFRGSILFHDWHSKLNGEAFGEASCKPLTCNTFDLPIFMAICAL
jgi:hypothetical protein